MQIVVDASLLVALVLREPHAERIEDLIRRWDEEGAVLNAPLLTHYEVASALTRHRATGSLSAEDVGEALEIIDALEIVFHPPVEQPPVIEIAAVELRRHSAYDAAYVALADRLDAELWTLDGPLARNARPPSAQAHRLSRVALTVSPATGRDSSFELSRRATASRRVSSSSVRMAVRFANNVRRSLVWRKLFGPIRIEDGGPHRPAGVEPRS